MRKQRKRPMHYYASRLYDGTIIATFPVRKPSPHVIKRDHLEIEADGICLGDLRSGEELRNGMDDRRFRFQDIIANSLNARRAVRDLAVPLLEALSKEVAEVRTQLDRIERLLQEQSRASS